MNSAGQTHEDVFHSRGYTTDLNERYTRGCADVWKRAIHELTKEMEFIDGSEWAKRYRRMGKGSNFSRWNPELNPFLKEIGETISSPKKEHGVVVVGKAVQMGATEVLLNEILRRIHISPGNILMYMEKEDKVKNMINTRFDVAIKQKPFREATVSKDGLHRSFVDGSLYCYGSNSPSGMSSFEAPLVIADEVVRYPDDIGGEGDFLQLAKGRITTFGDRGKIVMVSSFVSKRGRGRNFWNYFVMGDQREYMCPCWECGTYYLWAIEHLEYHTEKNAFGMKCPHCGGYTHDGDERVEATLDGKWFATTERSAEDVTSYRINGLVANKDFKDKGWHTMHNNHRKALGNEIPIQGFYNVQLGLPYEEGEIITPSSGEIPLKMNDISYSHVDDNGQKTYDIPPDPPVDDLLFLTMGVDCHKSNLEWEIKGWAQGYTSYSLDRGRIDFSPRQTSDCIDALRYIMHQRYGGIYRVWLCAIDSGYESRHVYEIAKAFPDYVAARTGVTGCMVPIKGHSAPYNDVLIKNVPGDPVGKGKNVRRRKGTYIMLGTDFAKRELYNALNMDYEKEFNGKAYCPYTYPDEYYKELTAETMVTNPKGNVIFEIPKRASIRNEALDLHVYNRACVDILGYPWDKKSKKIKALLADNRRNMRDVFGKKPPPTTEDETERSVKPPMEVSHRMLERKRKLEERKAQRRRQK